MKKKSIFVWYIVIFALNISYFTVFYNNEYMRYEVRKCVVLDKLTTTGGYKYSGQFYLILQEERGIKFDLIVSPTTFSQHKKDDIVYFNLRNMDINQTFKENIIYFFGGGMMIILIFCSWIGALILSSRIKESI
jgi:hypothetical protein